MSLSKDDLLEIMTKAKELGVTKFKNEELELIFESASQSVQSKKKARTPIADFKAEDAIQPITPFDELSDEEILYFGTPYFDELQAKKADKEKAIQESRIQ